jgi:hypothetical protein
VDQRGAVSFPEPHTRLLHDLVCPGGHGMKEGGSLRGRRLLKRNNIGGEKPHNKTTSKEGLYRG